MIGRIAAATLIGVSAFAPLRAAELELQPGDHICLVGNALGERMQVQNEWESLLTRDFRSTNWSSAICVFLPTNPTFAFVQRTSARPKAT